MERFATLTDTELHVYADRIRGQLSRAWAAGDPGKMSDVYDLARLRLEGDLRGLVLRPLRDENQLQLFEED